MILVDANLLLYAEDSASPQHDPARRWWDAQLSGRGTVCLCWPVLTAFIRIATNRRLYEHPLTLAEATARVQSWLQHPSTRVVQPTQGHWQVIKGLLEQGQAVGNLVTDAHLAALAIEHGCELYSTDSDFARFPTLQWHNPLARE